MEEQSKKEKQFTLLAVPASSPNSRSYEIVSGLTLNELPVEVFNVLNFHGMNYDVRHTKYGSARFHTMLVLTIYNEWNLFEYKLKDYLK